MENNGNGTSTMLPATANSTDTSHVRELKFIHDILIVTLLVLVMFAMGCHITWQQLWHHVRRPVGITIGMCSQFILLPLSAYGLIHVLKLEVLHATGLLLLACCPGGVTSNIFTYFCEGDTSLSIAMTTCSTVVALGMMPLNLYIYGSNLDSGNVVIPYDKMALSLLAVTCPVGGGMLVHWRFSRAAKYITKIGSVSGFLIIIICQTMEAFIFPNVFLDVPWQLYLGVVVLPMIGFSLGYFVALLFRQAPAVRRSISIESGVQNVGTALTVASLSFPFELQGKVLLFPWLYAFSMTAVCIIISIIYRSYRRCSTREKSMDVISGEVTIREVQYSNKESEDESIPPNSNISSDDAATEKTVTRV